MASQLSRWFRTIYFVMFIVSLLYILSITDSDLYDLAAIARLINLLDYFIAILELLATALATAAVVAALSIFDLISRSFTIPFTDIRIGIGTALPTQAQNTMASSISSIAATIFPNSTFLHIPNADPVQVVFELLNVYGIAIAAVVIPIALVSAIGFLTRGEARLAIVSFVCVQILLMVAMFIPNPGNPSGRFLLIDLTLPTFTGTPASMVSDLVLLLSKPIFLIGLGLYIVLEISFQASYTINVIDPMIDREKRIKQHLRRIDTFVPAHEDKRTTETQLGSTSTAIRKYDLLAASYLREMLDRRIFKRGDRDQDEKTSLRLQSYVRSLRQTDHNFERKITAISAQPKSWGIAKNVIPLITFRVIAVVIISFLILNPTVILTPIIANPRTGGGGFLQMPSLIESIELTQPEFRTVILFNALLIIIALAAMVHFLLVHRPKTEKAEVKKVETIVDFKEIKETAEEEQPAEAPSTSQQ